MGTFSRSLNLAKQSWSILRTNPELALFPLISGLVTIVVMASFAVPGFFVFRGLEREGQFGVLHYAFMFAFYLVTYFVVIFFNSGLVSCANEILAGNRSTFKEGMNAASKRIGAIFVYALISATVGMILRAISERAGILGRIVLSVLGFAWTILTYFVVPVLVIEGKSPVDAIKDSGSMLKRTWGENLVGNASINFVFMLLSLVAMIPAVLGFFVIASGIFVPGVVLIVTSVLFLIVLSLISSTLTGVYQTALYVYARTGQVPSQYDPSIVQFAFKQKGQRDY
jgi:hypothetical protein